MVGPQLRFTFGSAPSAVSVADLIVLGAFGWLAIDDGRHQVPSDVHRAAGAVLIAALFLVTGLGLEQARLRLAGALDRASPTLLSLFGGVVITRTEAIDQERSAAHGRAGFLLDGAALLAFAGIAVAVYDEPGFWNQGAFILFALLTGMAAVRVSSIQGLSGGKMARWYLALIFDDDDDADQAARALSTAVSAMYLFCGFLVLVQQSPWSPWGLPMMAAGADCAALTQWSFRRQRWVRIASTKRVSEIGHSKLPTVKQSAPISELLSIFAVEGQRALVVVTDDRGQPAGVIRLRQLRAAVHAGHSSHPAELMITLSNVPHIDEDTTILDAALFLERTGQLAMVCEGAAGRLRVVSLDELRAIID